jgi:hypothetical protein
MAGVRFYVQSDYPTARAAVDEVLSEAGFKMNYVDNFNVEAERGSKGKTLLLGAMAGKKGQHMKLGVNYGEEQGVQVVTFMQTNTGAAGGVIGYARLADIFNDLAAQIRQKYVDKTILVNEAQV